MSKADYAPLLPAGQHAITVAQLEELVAPRGCPRRREDLMNGIAALILHLQRDVGLHGSELWVDGSLLTVKPEPADWDAVLWLHDDWIERCNDKQYALVEALKMRGLLRLKYCVDLYLGRASDDTERQYWDNLFQLRYDGTRGKGYAVIIL